MDNGLNDIELVRINKRGLFHLLAFSNQLELKAPPNTVKKLELSEGLRFSPDEFEKLRSEIEKRFAYFTAESVLAGRPYSVEEFRAKLHQKGLEKTHIDKIIREFQAGNLLDDYRYAAIKVQSLMEHKPAGRSYLIAYLQSRRVPREIAEEAVDEALAHTSEADIASQLLRKRRISFMKFDVETARRKAYNYLSRRGISYRAAKEAFENLFLRPRD